MQGDKEVGLQVVGLLGTIGEGHERVILPGEHDREVAALAQNARQLQARGKIDILLLGPPRADRSGVLAAVTRVDDHDATARHFRRSGRLRHDGAIRRRLLGRLDARSVHVYDQAAGVRELRGAPALSLLRETHAHARLRDLLLNGVEANDSIVEADLLFSLDDAVGQDDLQGLDAPRARLVGRPGSQDHGQPRAPLIGKSPQRTDCAAPLDFQGAGPGVVARVEAAPAREGLRLQQRERQEGSAGAHAHRRGQNHDLVCGRGLVGVHDELQRTPPQAQLDATGDRVPVDLSPVDRTNAFGIQVDLGADLIGKRAVRGLVGDDNDDLLGRARKCGRQDEGRRRQEEESHSRMIL